MFIVISLVLATYNGEKFIRKQLESLIMQTKQFDEVLICDDCSTDKTVSIIKKIIYDNKLDNWVLYTNKKNKGWQQNFLDIMYLAHGEIIFYCDQDDIWFDNKVEVMVNSFNNNNNILCLSSRYLSIDSEGKKIEYRIDKKSNDTGLVKKIDIENKMFFNTPSGCTIAFKRKLLNYIDRNYTDVLLDRELCRIAGIINGFYDLDLSLMFHRFHLNNQTININKLKIAVGIDNLDVRIKILKQDILSLKKSKKILEENNVEKNLVRNIDLVNKFLNKRLQFLTNNCNFIVMLTLNRNLLKGAYQIIIGDICYKYNINRFASYLYRLFIGGL
ncbi:glycosyltransferase [Pectinatus sottacetonis]|uniref:glycosyltransferase n=1 Tax=Pectinatus sottacetonis TaxID=1002795 RepID=UPI001E4FC16F|nr:glycosyltransferase [Pectinatus sottacetonis]